MTATLIDLYEDDGALMAHVRYIEDSGRWDERLDVTPAAERPEPTGARYIGTFADADDGRPVAVGVNAAGLLVALS